MSTFYLLVLFSHSLLVQQEVTAGRCCSHLWLLLWLFQLLRLSETWHFVEGVLQLPVLLHLGLKSTDKVSIQCAQINCLIKCSHLGANSMAWHRVERLNTDSRANTKEKKGQELFTLVISTTRGNTDSSPSFQPKCTCIQRGLESSLWNKDEGLVCSCQAGELSEGDDAVFLAG